MKIEIKVNDELKVVELFEVTYETSEDRFKSLRLSNGIYPTNAILDYKDIPVTVENVFITNEDEFGEYFELTKSLKFNSDDKLINNWLHFKEGEDKSNISFSLQAMGRCFRV